MFNLYNHDCVEILQDLVHHSVKVDTIITDPPYEIGYKDWDKPDSLNWSELFYLFDLVTKPTANIVIFQGWSNVCTTISKMPSNMTLKNWIIYDRIKGRGAKNNLVSTREDILWIIKTKNNSYTYNKIPSTIKKKTGGLGLKNGCEYRALSNVWSDISPIVPWSHEKVAHPSQKPVQLMERCVELWSNEADVILDPFMGSGSTGVACKNTNRKFIGIEKKLEYFDIAKDRIGDVDEYNKP